MKAVKLLLGVLFVLGWMTFAFASRDGDRAGSEIGGQASSRAPASRAPSPGGTAGGAYPDDAPVVRLRGEVLSASDRLGRPEAAALVGSHLVVADAMGDPALHVLDPESGEVVSSFGRAGEGPGEFRSPRTLDPVHGEEAVWVFDIGLRRASLVALDGGRPPRDPQATPVVALQTEHAVLGAVRLGDGFLATGFFGSGRLARFGSEGRVLDVRGPLPPNPEDVPPGVLQHAWQSRLRVSPGRDRIVLAARHAPVLEIFRPDGSLVRRVWGPERFSPRYTVTPTEHGPVMSSGQDLRFGYVDAAPGQDRIFALYSGRTRRDHPDGTAPLGRHLHVFDWSGELVAVAELDADVYGLTLDADRSVIFGLRLLPAPAVLAFPLEGIP